MPPGAGTTGTGAPGPGTGRAWRHDPVDVSTFPRSFDMDKPGQPVICSAQGEGEMPNTKRKLSRVHFTSKAQDWGTPRKEFDAWHRAFRFTRDVCAEPGNAKLKRYWSKEDDAFTFHWGDGERNWMNPEYKHAAEWTRKARKESLDFGACTVGLVPVRTSEAWWVDNVAAPAGKLRGSWYDDRAQFWSTVWDHLQVHVHFIPYRLRFEKPGKTWQAPFPSALVVWEPHGEGWATTSIQRLGIHAV